MPIEVCSINKRRDVGKTPEEEQRLLGWLDSLIDPATKLPDVLCLQDFRVELALKLGRFKRFTFAGMTDHLITTADGELEDDRQLVGIGIASLHKLLKRRKPFTHGDGVIRPLQGVTKNDRIRPDSTGDDEIDNSEARRAIMTIVDTGTEQIPIGTVHGYWVRDGAFTPGQRRSTERTIRHVGEFGKKNGGVVMIADWNINEQMLKMLVDSGAREHPLPEGTETTMAPGTRAAEYKAKPDRIFQWPDAKGNYRYEVSNIRLSDAPGSDHLMLCATVGIAA